MPEDKKEPTPGHQLKVMTDQTGHKMAQKLFETYILGEETMRKKKADYKRMPEFILALDRLVSEFGGKPIPDDEPEAKIDADGNEDLGYGEDDDIHEAANLRRLKMSIARIIG